MNPTRSPSQSPRSPGRTRAGRWFRSWSVFRFCLAAFILILLLRAALLFVREALATEPLSGGLLLGVLVGLLLSGTAALWQEMAALGRTRAVRHLRRRIETAQRRGDTSRLRRALTPVLRRLGQHDPQAARDLWRDLTRESDAERVLALARTRLLAPIEQQADRLIRRHALATATAVAVVPHPALDALVVLWRSLSLVRDVAALYGLRPGPVATLALFRDSLANAGLAVGVDLTTEAALKLLWQGAEAQMAGALGEGAVTGARMLRLGREIKRRCAPF